MCAVSVYRFPGGAEPNRVPFKPNGAGTPGAVLRSMTDAQGSGRGFPAEEHRVPVVGTQRRQDAIWRIVGPPTQGPDSRAHWRGEATLEPEPENRHDPNAVRVAVGGETVGYLARELAARVQPAVVALTQRGATLTIPVYARGGFLFPDGERASVGLVLELDPEELMARRPAPP